MIGSNTNTKDVYIYHTIGNGVPAFCKFKCVHRDNIHGLFKYIIVYIP